MALADLDLILIQLLENYWDNKMAIDINSLFADIIDTPEQRQQKLLQQGMMQGQLLSSGLRGRAAALAPLAQVAGQLGVQRNENLRRAVQPMLGIDPRTTGEKMAEQLNRLDPNDPNSLLQAAKSLQSIDPVRAASLRQAAIQLRVEQSKLDQQQTQERQFRKIVAEKVGQSNRFSEQDVQGILSGSTPDEEVQRLYSELTAEKKPTELKPIQLINKEGVQSTAFFDGIGNFYDITDPSKKLNIEEGTTVISSSMVAGAKDFGDPAMRELLEAQAETYRFNTTANNIINMLEENEGATTKVAGLAAIYNDLVSEADAALKMYGDMYGDLTSKQGQDELFERLEIGRQSREVDSMLIGLSFQAAKAIAGQRGQSLSNKDFESFMKVFSANASDSQAIIRNIKREKQSLNDFFRYKHRAVTGEDFTGTLDPTPDYSQ